MSFSFRTCIGRNVQIPNQPPYQVLKIADTVHHRSGLFEGAMLSAVQIAYPTCVVGIINSSTIKTVTLLDVV